MVVQSPCAPLRNNIPKHNVVTRWKFDIAVHNIPTLIAKSKFSTQIRIMFLKIKN